MKRLLMVLVVLVVAAGAFATSTFNITAQLTSSISISCAGTWAAGSQAAGGNATMLAADAIQVYNTSTVGVTLNAAVTDPANWTAAGSKGANNYVLTVASAASAASAVTGLGSGVKLTTSAQGIGAIGLADGYVAAKLDYPTSSTTAASQTITVTLTAGAQ